MKKSVLFNTVAKKYAMGYIIMGFFVLVFLVSGLFENFYVSSRYSRATSELVAVNRLETAVNDRSRNVRELLRAEMTEAFELRKHGARRMGEEAGTRLLLPLFLMLGVVMVMVAVPAMLELIGDPV